MSALLNELSMLFKVRCARRIPVSTYAAWIGEHNKQRDNHNAELQIRVVCS